MTAERPPAVRPTSAVPRAEDDHARLARAAALMPAISLPLQAFDVLPGGLTNRNYRLLDAHGVQAVARISDADTALLAIDREAEFTNASIAAAHGVGPEVLGYAPGQGVSVVEWIDGRTFEASDLDDSTTLGRLADACRRLHSAPRFAGDFDMFAIQRRYREIVAEAGYRIPADYDDHEPVVRQIEAALAARPLLTVPCHNDLLAANIMDDGHQLWLIDYEYAGNNDPCFELGNIASEAHLSHDRLREFVGHYFGHESEAMYARARLYAVMSNYGWTLWAAIQDSVSPVDFDFWSWGLEKYDRAVAEFASADLSELISAVQQAN